MNNENDKSAEITILRKAGLTESQAKGYLALIENGELTPAELADKTGESRTNGYMIAEKLEKMGLAEKTDNKKAAYTPLHPSKIEILAEKRRRIAQKNEQNVKQSIDSLINLFYAHNELPGTRTLQGIDGIKTVFSDTIATGQDIYLLRTIADDTIMGIPFFDKYRIDRSRAKINTYALTPRTPYAEKWQKDGTDKKMLFHQTFYGIDDYTAPVEINVYGDKVALIAYGETQMATIINSPVIAEAMRQILKLLIKSYTD
ncbi:MAG: hypothetical protein LBL08_01080 [Candidatus Nomurabacteria bacterium]|jgi:DNA-binding MarR family transcriptional regulator|nr:hypothetical protein [Candidatus Nomurabacteria bacterium]